MCLTVDRSGRQCSWCKKFNHGGGNWMPGVPMGMSNDDIEITHGICEPCREKQKCKLKN